MVRTLSCRSRRHRRGPGVHRPCLARPAQGAIRRRGRRPPRTGCGACHGAGIQAGARPQALSGQTRLRIDTNSRLRLAFLFVGSTLMTVPTLLSAQVSLMTVVELSQRNSTAWRIAQADMRKAQAALSQTVDVYVPSLQFSSGLPAVPSVGFFGTPPSIFGSTMQSLVFSLSQRQYIQSAQAGLKAASLALKDAREQVALDASRAYIELDIVNHELAAARDQE